MTKHHEVFAALAPIDWDQVPHEDLEPFLNEIFVEALAAVRSIPSRNKWTDSMLPCPRSHTDSAAARGGEPPTARLAPSHVAWDAVERLQKEWKEVKVNAKDNSHDIAVYKLAAKDGKGAWFARQSVHDDFPFEQWRDGLEREFAETLKVQGSPGSGSIRGIGADKKVEHQVVDGVGQLEVFQLSAQFPGPTSPRDFVTLLLTSDRKSQADSVRREGTRQYIIVSKPCKHPDCPPREGIIRGQYESVEMIREIPVDAGASSKASLSTADLPGRDEDGQTDARPPLKAQDRENLLSDRMPPKACLVEWNMITRSEPGGSVPRFMVEKGTPPGIVSDAGKFLKWLRSECAQGHTDSDRVGDAPGSAETQSHTQPGRQERNGQEVGDANGEQDPGFTGHIGILDAIMGAVGASTSVASDPRRNLDDTREMQPEAHDDKNSTSSASDSSDARSFASALDGDNFLENVNNSVAESRSDDSSKAPSYHAAYAKELKKLEERRRKLDAKADRIQKRLEQKRLEDEQKDATAKAKVREKNEKELAKQEAKYKRELKKIEEKREAEERKAEQKRLKAVERDEKAKLLMDLDRMKVERELALKRVEALEAQIGDLKAQNTDLVAKLDKMRLGDASAPPEKTSGSGGPEA